MIHLSDTLELPDEILTRRVGILGMPGMGKTSTAILIAEQARAAGIQVVVIDPTGAWWGIAHNQAGDGPGADLVVLGGEHGSAPVTRDAGKACARLVAHEGLSCVLDVDRPNLTSWAARSHFVADFLGDLYELCRTRILVIIDEAHRFAPQNVRDEGGDSARCLGAVSDVVALGRRRGLDTILVTQRAAKLHKDVLELCGVLIAHQLRGNNDRAALKGWLDNAGGDIKTIMAAVAGLPRGSAFVSAPAYDVDDLYRILPKTTFDSSADASAGAVVTGSLTSEVDLEKIGRLLADTIKEVQAEDPAALRARIEDLERQLADGDRETAVEADRDLAHGQLAEIAEILGVDGGHGAVVNRVRGVQALARSVSDSLGELDDHVGVALTAIRNDIAKFELDGTAPSPQAARPALPAPAPSNGESVARLDGPGTHRQGPDRSPGPAAQSNGAAPIKAGARRMLFALYDAPRSLTRRELGTLAKVREGGTMSNYLSSLRDHDVVEADGLVALTARGEKQLNGINGRAAAERSPQQIIEPHLGDLKAGARRMLDLLLGAPDRGYSRAELGRAAGVSAGGTFSNYLSSLTRRGLAEERAKRVYPGAVLYLWEREVAAV